MAAQACSLTETAVYEWAADSFPAALNASYLCASTPEYNHIPPAPPVVHGGRALGGRRLASDCPTSAAAVAALLAAIARGGSFPSACVPTGVAVTMDVVVGDNNGTEVLALVQGLLVGAAVSVSVFVQAAETLSWSAPAVEVVANSTLSLLAEPELIYIIVPTAPPTPSPASTPWWSSTTTFVAVIFAGCAGLLCLVCGCVIWCNLRHRRAAAARPKVVSVAPPAPTLGLGSPRFSSRSVLGSVTDGFHMRSSPPPVPVTREKSWRLHADDPPKAHVGGVLHGIADKTWLRASAPPRPVVNPLLRGKSAPFVRARSSVDEAEETPTVGHNPAAGESRYLADAMRAQRVKQAWHGLPPVAAPRPSSVATTVVVPVGLQLPVPRPGASSAMIAARRRLEAQNLI